MTTYRREFPVPRLLALRKILTRRGLVLALRVETDAAALVATVDTNPPARLRLSWHAPEEIWEPRTSTYAEMADRSQTDPAYREGLLAAAQVARAQAELCPAVMVAVYVESIAAGELP